MNYSVSEYAVRQGGHLWQHKHILLHCIYPFTQSHSSKFSALTIDGLSPSLLSSCSLIPHLLNKNNKKKDVMFVLRSCCTKLQRFLGSLHMMYKQKINLWCPRALIRGKSHLLFMCLRRETRRTSWGSLLRRSLAAVCLLSCRGCRCTAAAAAAAAFKWCRKGSNYDWSARLTDSTM